MKILLKFVHNGPINNILALVHIMTWRRPGDKPSSEPMMVSLPTHICATWPQWVNHQTGESFLQARLLEKVGYVKFIFPDLERCLIYHLTHWLPVTQAGIRYRHPALVETLACRLYSVESIILALLNWRLLGYKYWTRLSFKKTGFGDIHVVYNRRTYLLKPQHG